MYTRRGSYLTLAVMLLAVLARPTEAIPIGALGGRVILFAEHTVDEDFDGALSVHATDMDDDGDIDVLGAALYADEIAWFENDGDESFAEHIIGGSFDDAVSVYAADVDGDGDMDVLGAADGADDITWWENDGYESFVEHTVDDYFDGARGVYATDVDGDGDVDVLGAAIYANDITWWENDGEENFTEHTIDGSFSGARSVYATDVDGDGDVDVLGAARVANDVTWWENDGEETFTKYTIDGYFDGVVTVHAADLDGDGDVDVLAGAVDADEIAWWENDGEENFTKRMVVQDFDRAISVYATDVDQGGDIDVLGAAYDAGKISWCENDGDGNFIEHIVDGEFGGARSVYASDLDGDGDVDVLGASPQTDEIVWWEQLPNVSPALTWTGEANYVDDGLHPEAGELGEAFVYRVSYSDANNDPPGLVQVHVKKGGVDIVGSPFDMSCDAGDYVAGVVCSFTTAGLDLGTDYSYLFTAQDDQGNDAIPTSELDAPDVEITYPTLDWPGDANYETDGLHPESGEEGDDYVYRVKYADAGGDPPGSVQVHVKKGGVDIVGSPFDMSCDTGDYVAGVVCSFTKDGLDPGSDYSYLFVGQDHHGRLATPTQEMAAPGVIVVYRLFLPLVLANAKPPEAPELYPIDNADGDGTYTVSWNSVAAAMAYTLEEASTEAFTDAVEVYSGSNVTTGVSGRDVGTYYYRVNASNSLGSSNWSNTQAVTVTIAAPVPEPGTWYGRTSWFENMQFRVSSDSSSVTDVRLVLHDECGVVTDAGPVPIESGHFSFGWFWGDFTATDEADGNYTFLGDTPNCGFVIETGSWDASR